MISRAHVQSLKLFGKRFAGMNKITSPAFDIGYYALCQGKALFFTHYLIPHFFFFSRLDL
jgi:hypothetical protein